MLSVAAMTSGQAKYYTDLARVNYYTHGGEPPGTWWGEAAASAGYTGRVTDKSLKRAFDGVSHDGVKLTHNAHCKSHRPGWDFAFSVPKSVSMLWSVAPEPERHAIQESLRAAVAAALEYVQDAAAYTRLGRGGTQWERVKLGAALFEHATSRAGDPQLHMHALILNFGQRENGKTGALASHLLYEHKMAAGAIFRAELAHLLETRLPVHCRRVQTWFELDGVPEALCDSASKRRHELKAHLGLEGQETASAAAFAEAARATRKTKQVVPPRCKLLAGWRQAAQQHGFTADQALGYGEGHSRAAPAKPEDILREALTAITEHDSHFPERVLVRRVAEASISRGLNAKAVLNLVSETIAQSTEIVRAGVRDNEPQYTTREMLSVEAGLLAQVETMRTPRSHVVSQRIVDRVINRWSRERSPLLEEVRHHAQQLGRAALGRRTSKIRRDLIARQSKVKLSAQQADAVRHLTSTPGRVKVLTGIAGTGKGETLGACREAWEKAGYKVIGAALSGKATRGLQSGSGIRTVTLATLEYLLNPSLGHRLKQHAKQLARTALNLPAGPVKPLRIDANTVLVIDEAGMVGTRQLSRIVETVNRHGGKLVLAGDGAQLQAIEAGCPFIAIAKRLGSAELTEIHRQREPRDRETVQQFARGDIGPALSGLAERGLVSVSRTRDQAMDALVDAWAGAAASRPQGSLIFCNTNYEADAINQRCQNHRILTCAVDASESLRTERGMIAKGDRVLFTKRSKSIGVENGDLGTVRSINRTLKTMSVKLDTGRHVRIWLPHYRHGPGERNGELAVRLGYAVTTHKGQGTTVDRAYILAGGSMQDAQISYVQASRARVETRVFTDEREAGENLARLARQMSRSRAKVLASDLDQHPHGAHPPGLEH